MEVGVSGPEWSDSRTYQTQTGGEVLFRTKGKAPKKKWITAKIQLARSILLAPMSQIKVKMVTNATGMILINPKGYRVPKYNLRAAGGVAEVFPERPFDILFSNFGNRKRRLPNVMVFSHSTKYPLSLVRIRGEG